MGSLHRCFGFGQAARSTFVAAQCHAHFAHKRVWLAAFQQKSRLAAFGARRVHTGTAFQLSLEHAKALLQSGYPIWRCCDAFPGRPFAQEIEYVV